MIHITNTLLFLLIKSENPHILSTKNNSVFAYVVGIYVTSWGLFS